MTPQSSRFWPRSPKQRQREGKYGEPAVLELLDTLDGYIPEPERAIDKPFLMPIRRILNLWSWYRQ